MAITGATGFIGRHLCRHFAQRGWRVRGLVRNVNHPALRELDVEAFRCSLPDAIDPAAFDGADALVHGAYTSRYTSLADARRVNEQGTDNVLALARKHGVQKFVFLSTTSAHDGALSYYARSKLALERRMDLERDLVFRLGLVLGPDGGLFQRISGTIRRTGIVPLLDGGRQPVQTVHVDDLGPAIVGAVERGLSGTFVLAEPEALTMRELFDGVATRLGRRCLRVPVPTRPLLLLLNLAERLRIPLPVSSENLLGARALKFQHSADDLTTLGVTLRAADASLDQVFASCGESRRGL